MRALCALALGSLLIAGSALAGAPLPPPTVAPSTSPGPVPAIPEPAAVALFVLGAGVVGLAIRRRKS